MKKRSIQPRHRVQRRQRYRRCANEALCLVEGIDLRTRAKHRIGVVRKENKLLLGEIATCVYRLVADLGDDLPTPVRYRIGVERKEEKMWGEIVTYLYRLAVDLRTSVKHPIGAMRRENGLLGELIVTCMCPFFGRGTGGDCQSTSLSLVLPRSGSCGRRRVPSSQPRGLPCLIASIPLAGVRVSV